jgi:outer membrane murein-binding lipoprotein Lpp
MDRKTTQTGSGSTVLIIILAVVAGLAVAGALYNQNRVMQLQKQLADLTKQVQEVNQQAEAVRQDVLNAAEGGLEDVAKAIQGVDSPQVRLSLFKAYANKLKAALTPEAKIDLDKIIVYVEKQPVVLVQKPAQLPAEIQTAIDNIKTEVQKAKVTAVAATTMKQTAGTPTPAAGKTVVLTGMLAEGPADTMLGGNVYTLVDNTDGQTYYFQFSDTNAVKVNSMVGQDVSITIKTTGTTADGMVTYEVVSGPTLVADVTPTVKPTIAAGEE